mmetsp:Transcript_29673/g.65746  ORF Transcript_29673/g.65746 Transcript_29673/m.65746 type:complete len:253 (-) Transcript_29673:65-823(-)
MASTLNRIIVKQATLPVLTSSGSGGSAGYFPVGRIFCVGRNYREHALEMGGDPDRETPFFFLKPSDAIVDTYIATTGTSNLCIVPYPSVTSSLHFEGELVVAIARAGFRIPVEDAENHIYGYAVGCDLTRRDLQAVAKKKGRPWDAAKGFDNSAPCGPIIPKDDASGAVSSSAILSLAVNGKLRQETTLDRMVWNIPETISHLSTLFRLKPGDLLFTGTPAGVGGLDVDDTVSVTCGDLPACEFRIGPPETE